MKKIKLDVIGMKCKGCEARVQNTLKEVSDISDVKASFKKGEVIIKYKTEINIDEICGKIENLGFEVKKED